MNEKFDVVLVDGTNIDGLSSFELVLKLNGIDYSSVAKVVYSDTGGEVEEAYLDQILGRENIAEYSKPKKRMGFCIGAFIFPLYPAIKGRCWGFLVFNLICCGFPFTNLYAGFCWSDWFSASDEELIVMKNHFNLVSLLIVCCFLFLLLI